MRSKDIQEQRIKSYFIEATKEIIKSEGIKALSVRTVSVRAGYSYATLYNYFKDLNDLIFICVSDFQKECIEFVNQKINDKDPIEVKIKSKIKSLANYFVQYPGIFELMYIEKMNDIGNQEKISLQIYNFFDDMCQEEWDKLNENNKMKKDVINQKKMILNHAVVGALVFYMNRQVPTDYSTFISNLDNQIDLILS